MPQKKTTRRKKAEPAPEANAGSILLPLPEHQPVPRAGELGRPMLLLMVGSEALPFAASGGLGDVLGSLPAALKARMENAVDIRVVMPLYGQIKSEWREKMTFLRSFTVYLAWRKQYCGLFTLEKDGVTWYFLDNEYYFQRAAPLRPV